MSDKLYEHKPRLHTPKSINSIHQSEQQGFNTRLAVWLTRVVGTMPTAYLFAIIGIAGMIGAFTSNTFLVLVFGSISSYFLQLVLLPVILVGSNVLNRKQELQSEEDFRVNQASFHDIEQIVKHMEAQDKLLQRILFLQTREQLSLKGASMSLDAKAIVAPENRTNEDGANT